MAPSGADLGNHRPHCLAECVRHPVRHVSHVSHLDAVLVDLRIHRVAITGVERGQDTAALGGGGLDHALTKLAEAVPHTSVDAEAQDRAWLMEAGAVVLLGDL